jgi:molecular chaperone DnaK (HSP70)
MEKLEKSFFIEAVELTEIQGRRYIPTALFYDGNQVLFGQSAISKQRENKIVNTNFKVALGEYRAKSSKKENRLFETAGGTEKSAFELTKDFFDFILYNVEGQVFEPKYRKKGLRIIVAEPLSFQIQGMTDSWIKNYRDNIKRILHNYENVEFLPEPFAVYQFYRYGLKIPQLKDNIKHIVLIIDFGGGTFDASIIESTRSGDLSLTGKHSSPLASSSEPYGGFFINEKIGEYLIKRDLDEGEKKKAWQNFKTYRRVIKGELDIDSLNAEKRSFIKNLRKLIQQIENKKIELCNSIQNWDLEYESYEKVFLSIPQNPFDEGGGWQDISFHGHELRKIFRHEIWESLLKKAIKSVFERAAEDLKGKKISATLISGGSSNIRWLEKLLLKDFGVELSAAAPIPLSGSFQEIVAKGLSIECARRHYDPDSEFVSVTYNPVRLLLNPDGRGIELRKFSSVENKIDMEKALDGDILPSAQALKNFIEEPLQWKVNLLHPPRKFLKYHFMRPSKENIEKQPEDFYNLYNVDNISHTTPGTKFSSKIRIELTVKNDGTAYPRFIYRVGHPEAGVEEHSEKGEPFVLDMTSESEEVDINRYIGFDFGTSNSSICYLSNDHIHEFNIRAEDSSWLELQELIPKLPYAISFPLRKYLSLINKNQMVEEARDAFEAMLGFAAYISVSELIACGKYKKEYLKSFPHRSMGPLKDLLKKTLKKLGKAAFFSAPFLKLFESFSSELDNAIRDFNDHKHKKIAGEKVPCHEYLKFLANILSSGLENRVFGYFASVQPIKFKRGLFRGVFKAASDNQPFFDKYKYEGSETFDISEPILVDLLENKALSLFPFYFWDEDTRYADSVKCFVFDKTEKSICCYKAIEEENLLELKNDYEELNERVLEIFQGKNTGNKIYSLELDSLSD